MNAHMLLTFSTEGGRRKSYRIPNARLTVTDADARNAMQMMRNSNVFLTPSGILAASRRAALYEVSQQSFDVQ